MQLRARRFLIALVALLAAPATLAAQPSATLAFVGANVLPMDGERVLADQTVLVRAGRIVALGSRGSVVVPSGATVIDASGKYLMPGVSEMHGHYPQPGTEFANDVLFLYVANGVTVVRGMQGGPQHVPLRDAIERGEVLGPRLWVSAPSMAGAGPNGITEPATAESLVREAHASGIDHLKVHENLSLPVYDAIADTANELQLPFSGHVSNRVGLYHALAKGQATIDHLDNVLEAMVEDREAVEAADLFGLAALVDGIDEAKIDQVVAAFRVAGAGVVPTMELWEILFGAYAVEEIEARRPEIRTMPAEMVAGWRRAVEQRHANASGDMAAVRKVLDMRRRVLRALYDGGVPVLLGTDSPQIYSVPGFSIHHEMALMIEAGLTPYQVLEAGTRKVAEFYGALGDFGMVAVGHRADLVLLNANPLEDVARFADRAGVMVHGRWLPEEEIQQRLRQVEARAATS